MSTQRNNYDLSYPTPSANPGFVIFQRKEPKLYCFHLNDLDGNTLLYSEGYTTIEGRNNGIQSVKKNATISNRYKILEEENGFYFILRAGNYHEIARSRNFERQTQAQIYINQLHSMNLAQEIQIAQTTLQALVKSESIPPEPPQQKTKPTSHLKYNFRIELYPREHDNSMKGKIENILTGKKKALTGLDGNQIIRFITDNLRAEDRQPVENLIEEEDTLWIVPPPKASTKKKTATTNFVDTFENINLVLMSKKSEKPRRHWQSNDAFEIQLQLKEDTQLDWDIGKKILMELKVEPIQSSKYAIHWMVEVAYEGGRAINLPNYKIPFPGLYHLKARTKNDGSLGKKLAGGTVVNIY